MLCCLLPLIFTKEKPHLKLLFQHYLKNIYSEANDFSLEFNNLGPLRKTPNSNDKIKGDIFPRKNIFKYYSLKIAKNINAYSGQNTWEHLAISTYTLKDVNNWLANWFNTPYKINFQPLYTLVIDTPEKQQALEEGRITQEHFATFNFQLRIKNLFNDSVTGAEEIGIGISQLTPVIVNALVEKNFSVEQPELHIHPKMQTILGDLFIFAGLFEPAQKYIKNLDYYTDNKKIKDTREVKTIKIIDLYGKEKTYKFQEKADANKSFILAETHSEHLLLRLLKRIREGILNPQDLAINYIASQQGKSQVTPIGVNQDGDFTNQWPDGFFEERLDELF